MNDDTPTSHETPPQPVAQTPEKKTIRVSQEEFVDDTAGPSIDRSEYHHREDRGVEGAGDSGGR